MTSKKLSAFTAGVDVIERVGGVDPSITGLAYDSRAVGPGALFFALDGLHTDGHRFIDSALRFGALAIVHTRPLEAYRPGCAYLRVADARAAMSTIADAYFDHPSRSLRVIGVTGTEGKSTTVFLIYQLLELAGHAAGFFSTVMSRTGRDELPNPEHQTTPEATAVHRMLAEMRDSGFGYAVVEASSHGLSPRTSRLADVAFDVGVMLNVTHEHLEFHGSWEQYRFDKANLFRALDGDARLDASAPAHEAPLDAFSFAHAAADASARAGTAGAPGGARERAAELELLRHAAARPPRKHRKRIAGALLDVPVFGVVNARDPSAAYFAAATRAPVLTYAVERPASAAAAGTAATDPAAVGRVNADPAATGADRAAAGREIADLVAIDVRPDAAGSSFTIVARDAVSGREPARFAARIELPGEFNVENTLAALAVAARVSETPIERFVPLLPRLRPVRGRMMSIERGQPFDVVVDYAHTPSSFETVFRSARGYARGRLIALFGSAGERDTQKRALQGRVADEWCDLIVLADEDPRGEEPIAILEEIASGIERKRRGDTLLLVPDRREAIRAAFARATRGDLVLLLGKGHESTIIYRDLTIPWDEERAAIDALSEMGFRGA